MSSDLGDSGAVVSGPPLPSLAASFRVFSSPKSLALKARLGFGESPWPGKAAALGVHARPGIWKGQTRLHRAEANYLLGGFLEQARGSVPGVASGGGEIALPGAQI